MIKNFITTGCSFTAGFIPLPHIERGSWERRGSVWPHFCFANLTDDNNTLVNLALAGGGNISAMMNLVYFLETHKDITPENTLIGFNITGLNRVDNISDLNDKINTNFCCIDPQGLVHPSQEMGFGWVTEGVDEKNPIDILSCLTVIQAITYLEHKKFRYFFMLMVDEVYDYAPSWFKEFLDSKSNSWVKFDGISGMFEFAEKYGLVADDGHPTIDGHKLISQYVMNFLNNKYKENFFKIGE